MMQGVTTRREVSGVTQDIVARRGSMVWNLKRMHEVAGERYTVGYRPQDGTSPKGHHFLALAIE